MMNGFMRVLVVMLVAFCLSCSTTETQPDSGSSTTGSADFSDFSNDSGGNNPEQGVESELSQESGAKEAPAEAAAESQAEPQKDEFADFDKSQTEQKSQEAPSETAPEAPAPVAEAAPMPESDPVPPPMAEVAPEPEAPAPVAQAEPQAVETSPVASAGALVNIVDLQYRANDNGGTVVIEGSAPLQFQPRMNPQTNQFVVEVPNSKIPRRLKRPFNTRDFGGTIGSIDAYQGKTSTTTRIVVQLRPGAPEPVVQAEGNNIFIVAQPPAPEAPAGSTDEQASAASAAVAQDPAAQSEAAAEEPAEVGPAQSKLLASDGIEEFLTSNQTFYGKRISIEADEAEVRDLFRMIGEEANVNLVMSDEVKGKLSIKLKQVPWDQALVMIMKAKKMGYTRVGNVLRIAPLKDIKQEEDDALKFVAARKASAAFKVKTIQVNYAKVDELEKQLRGILSAKGTVVGDQRTSALIVTDIDENIERAQKLVAALDIPPQQVLIEGKVVEASDNFQRRIGVNWAASGRAAQFPGVKSSQGNLRGITGFSVNPSVSAGSTFGLNFTMGTLDILGDLSATLRLFENQGLVKVVSSPRVVTLHNEAAEISQTTEIPLITATTNANGSTTPSVSFKPVRLRLQVNPHITNDGSVIMSVDVTRETAGEVANQDTQARPVNSRSAKTKVIVRNSQTAVIGGIYQNEATESEDRVPGLGQIPVVGWLFKSNQKEKRRSELLIFLTPRILGQLEAAPTSPVDSGGEL